MGLLVDIRKRLRGPEGPMELEVAFEVGDGEVFALYGPSGAGKTTILRLLAGLDRPDSGIIRHGEEIWYDGKKKIFLSARKRQVGMVFQDYALFPNQTVRRHIHFARPRGLRQPEDIESFLLKTGLHHLADRKPRQLSGGQQQRLALARALASSHEMLLLDEPLSAQDGEMRSTMQEILLSARLESRPVTLLVSHDPLEVLRLADRVAVLKEGRIVEMGRPVEVFRAKSESQALLIPARIWEIKEENGQQVLVLLAQGRLIKVNWQGKPEDWRPGDIMMLGFDPESRRLLLPGEE